jgi:hypothetical protein
MDQVRMCMHCSIMVNIDLTKASHTIHTGNSQEPKDYKDLKVRS